MQCRRSSNHCSKHVTHTGEEEVLAGYRKGESAGFCGWGEKGGGVRGQGGTNKEKRAKVAAGVEKEGTV